MKPGDKIKHQDTRKRQAAAYRDMRRKGFGRMARLLWRRIRNAENALDAALAAYPYSAQHGTTGA